MRALLTARGLVDLIIPRGGAGLIQTVVTESTVPVIETGVGIVHVYVDAAADLDKALAITVNAKTHRPSVCNAAESLLVHQAVAADFLPKVLAELSGAGVVLHTDEASGAAAEAAGVPHEAATDEDYGDRVPRPRDERPRRARPRRRDGAHPRPTARVTPRRS